MEGQKRSSIPEASFMVSTEVILIPLICFIFKKEKISIKIIIAAIISIIGLFIFNYDKGSSLNLFSVGNLLNFITAILFSVQIILLEPIAKIDKSFSASMIRLFTIGVIGIFLMPINGMANFGDLTYGIIGMIYIALFGSFAAFTLQSFGQKYVDSSTTSVLIATQSFFGTIFGCIVFSTKFTWQIGVGGAIIFISVLIACLDLKKIFKRKDTT